MWTALRSIRAWQAGVVGVVFLATAAATATVGVSYWLTDSREVGRGELAENEQVVPVQIGDLVNQVSTSGSVVFPTRETLSFGVAGTIGEVLVAEGDEVVVGQILARLDDATVALLDEAVAKAKLTFREREEALALAFEPYTALDLALAESRVAAARLTLAAAEEALGRALRPYTEHQVRQQEEAVARTRVGLRDAEAALERGRRVGARSLAEAEHAVAVARATQAAAVAVFDAASTVTADQLAAAENGALAAEQVLQAARDALASALDSDQDDAVVAQRERIAQAQLDLDSARRSASISELNNVLAVARAQDDVDAAALQVDRARVLYEAASFGNETPRLDALNAARLVHERAVAARGLARARAESDAAGAQLSIDRAAAALQTAGDALAELLPTGAMVQERRNQVSIAEAALVRAQEQLSGLLAGPDDLVFPQRRAELEVANATLVDAEEDLATLRAGVDGLDVALREAQVATATAALAAAAEELAGMVPDTLTVEARQQDLAEAQLSIAVAEENLAELQEGADAALVALRRAEVTSARTALVGAEEARANFALVSPLAGLVSFVNVEARQMAGANTPVLEIVDPTDVEVDGIVDEIDVLFVREGAAVSVTLDALPDTVLSGTISEIAAAGQSQQGVVTYPIRIGLEVPQGVELREGLTAAANIVLRAERGVVLLPLQALHGSFDEPVVRVMTAGRIEERAVVLGSNDDFWVAVREGLGGGELVVMQSQEASTTQFGVGLGGFRPGGGQPGGGVVSGRGGGTGGR